MVGKALQEDLPTPEGFKSFGILEADERLGLQKGALATLI